MIQTNQSVTLHNRFDLQLIDSVTGKVKQTAQAENTVLDRFLSLLFSSNRYGEIVMRIPGSLVMGTGSGTPGPSDTSLFQRAFSRTTYSTDSHVKLISREIASPTSTLIYSVEFPASSSFVGTLTEIGVAATSVYSEYLITHAMLSDAEGNPISIEKTELDILIVTVTLYLTMNNNDDKFIPYLNNGITNIFNLGPNDSGSSVWGNAYLYRCATDKFVGSEFELSGSKTYDSATKTFTFTGTRVGTGSGNANGSTYYNAIGIRNHGYIRFPNASIFPNYTVSSIPIGTGDGATTDFDCPFALFVNNSDTIYKNGVALTRGSDYTISNINYKPNNICVTAGNFADVSVSGDIYSTTTFGSIPFMLRNDANTYVYKPTSPMQILVDLTSTDPTIGRKTDFFTLNISGLYRYYWLPDDLTFECKVEYSTDNVTWVEVDAATTITNKGYTSSGNYYMHNFTIDADFDEIDAPYIRITVTTIYSATGNFFYIRCNDNSALGKKGGQIHFTNAPATGDVITMSCQLDRPYKSSSYVLDASMSITLSS